MSPDRGQALLYKADLGSIQLYLDGVTQSFSEWTEKFVDAYYPNVGQRCYRVPAIHFNQQRLVSQANVSALSLHTPDASKARGELAHTVVLENMEHLGHRLENDGCPLFIISALNYDNYLYRVKPPPSTKGKENRPRSKAKARTSEHHHDSKTAGPQHDASQVSNSPRDDRTSRGSDTKHKDDGPTNDSEPLCATKGSPTDTKHKSNKQSPHKKHRPRRKKADHNVPKNDSRDAHGDNAKSERSPTHQAENVPTTSAETIIQDDREGAKHAVSDSQPMHDRRQDPGTLRAGSARIKQSTCVQHCSKEAEEPAIEPQNSTNTATPRAKIKTQKEKEVQVIANTQAAPQFLGRVDENSNRQEPPSPRSPQSREKTPTLPPRPSDKGQRGDIDVLLLHQQCGVVLMEVKSTGMPHQDFTYSDQEILDSVHKAVEQLKRGRGVFRFIMADMVTSLGITLVVALPYVSRELLTKVLGNVQLDPDVVFLCHDDLISGSSGQQPARSEDTVPLRTDDVPVTSQDVTSSLVTWWEGTICPRATPLSLEHMRSIVGRVCGLLSIVSVWTRTKPRVEVRTPAQAISEAGDRISDIVLLPEQSDLLAQPFLSHLCLTGPMGAGKTLLLQLKGRQWLQEGRRVVILNVRTSGRGRPAAYVMEEAIGRGQRGAAAGGSVERHDLATKELDMGAFVAELEEMGPTHDLAFVMDELTHYTFPMLEWLTAAFPRCRVWCVAMFVRQLPSGFHHHRLGAVLRSPPSVQLLLQELDLNPVHAGVYSTRSAARGLPCDGPPVALVQHERHDTTLRLHDCVRCADDLVEVLQDTLGLLVPGLQCPGKSASLLHPPRMTKASSVSKAVEARPLSFRDVLLLVCVPLGYYHREEDGLWMASKEKLFKVCGYLSSSPFFTRLKSRGVPMKIVYDNTSREIAFPSTNEIIVTDVMGVQSLERKVVIYLPGGPVLDGLDDTPSDGRTGGGCQSSNTASDEQVLPPAGSSQSHCQAAKADNDCPRPSAHSATPASSAVHAQGQRHASPTSSVNNISERSPQQRHPGLSSVDYTDKPADAVREGDDEADRPAKEKKPSVEVAGGFSINEPLSNPDSLFGNMIVDDTKAKINNIHAVFRSRPLAVAEDRTDQPKVKHRMGMDVRGDSPMLLSALKDARAARQSSCPVGYFHADSTFLAPDAEVSAGHVEVERQRLRQAASSMSMDDQDWLFIAAARCLSQLIVIVPSRSQADL